MLLDTICSQRLHNDGRRKSKGVADERRVEGESQGDLSEELHHMQLQQPYLRAAPRWGELM